jgi:protein TonB
VRQTTRSRNFGVAAGVVLLHAAALWALRAGPLERRAPVVVPVTLVPERVTPPAPLPPQAPPRPQPPPRPVAKARDPERPAPPRPAPAPTVIPAPPAESIQPEETSPERLALPAAPVAGGEPAAPPGPPAGSGGVELPSSDAGYLQNPAPVYPALSKRLGEKGKVLLRVLIGADGTPQKAELKRSSGFDRLDRSALEYVMRCRYVPGRVGGVPQAMWYEAPVNYVLE